MNMFRTLLSWLPQRQPRLQVLHVTSRPAEITTLLVPQNVATATLAHLRAGGKRGCEEFAFWTGHSISDDVGVVSRVFCPKTVQGRGHVTITDDRQLLSMIDMVHEHNELVLCQIHTHPSDAFHSQADDQGALTDEPGFLSLVLPDFGAGGLATAEAYRRTNEGWMHLGCTGTNGLLQIFGDVVHYSGKDWYEHSTKSC